MATILHNMEEDATYYLQGE